MDNLEWTISWLESDPNVDPSLPNARKIHILKDGQEMVIVTESQFSPQHRTSNLVVDAMANNVSIILVAEHLTVGADTTSFAFSPNTALCDIQTMAPTQIPTADPTTKSPTKSPVPIPTVDPTKTPTAAPTYFVEIEWCQILIIDHQWYSLTFLIPDFEPPSTPTLDDTLYLISYGNDPEEVDAVGYGDTVRNVTERRYAISNISFESDFKMTVRNKEGTFYGQWTLCEVLTNDPTPFPTILPTAVPTVSPSEPPVGVFVYDDERICGGDRRCACHLDFYNYECAGSDHPELSQIEDSIVYFVPSDGVQQTVLSIGRLPRNLGNDVVIEWRFVYLNRTEDVLWDQRINPIVGSTTVRGGDDLGQIATAEFVNIVDEQTVQEKWYRFEITSCTVSGDEDGESVVDCGAIYPSWAYVLWVPQSEFNAIIFGGGDVIPDWIFYLMLGGS